MSTNGLLSYILNGLPVSDRVTPTAAQAANPTALNYLTIIVVFLMLDAALIADDWLHSKWQTRQVGRHFY